MEDKLVCWIQTALIGIPRTLDLHHAHARPPSKQFNYHGLVRRQASRIISMSLENPGGAINKDLNKQRDIDDITSRLRARALSRKQRDSPFNPSKDISSSLLSPKAKKKANSKSGLDIKSTKVASSKPSSTSTSTSTSFMRKFHLDQSQLDHLGRLLRSRSFCSQIAKIYKTPDVRFLGKLVSLQECLANVNPSQVDLGALGVRVEQYGHIQSEEEAERENRGHGNEAAAAAVAFQRSVSRKSRHYVESEQLRMLQLSLMPDSDLLLVRVPPMMLYQVYERMGEESNGPEKPHDGDYERDRSRSVIYELFDNVPPSLGALYHRLDSLSNLASLQQSAHRQLEHQLVQELEYLDIGESVRTETDFLDPHYNDLFMENPFD